MSKKIMLIMGMVSVLLVQIGFADTRIFKVPIGTSGDWNVATNWTGDAIPTAADSTFIRDGRTANVNVDVGTVTRINIGDAAGTYNPTGTVNILSGQLVVSTEVEVGRRDAAGSVGYLNISGGTFDAGDPAILIGADLGESATGVLEVSGTGTLIGRMIIGSDEVGDSGDVLRIVGSDATVGSTSTAGSYAVQVRDSGTVEWVFDETGVATASFPNDNFTFSGTGGKIVVDGSAYTGGSQTFTLLEAGAISGTEPTIELVGFDAGVTYDWDSANDVLTVTTPTPTTVRVFEVPAGTSGDWNVATNWSGDKVPDSNETAFIRDGRTANIDADVGTIEGLNIGDQTALYNPTGIVNILSGSLVVSSEVEVGRRDAAGSIGYLNISGGTFQAGDSTGDLAVLIGSDAGESATGVLEVSGTGTFTGRAIVGSDDVGDSNDVFRIVGSDVTVGSTSSAGIYAVQVRDSGTVEWVFDTNGVATVSFPNNNFTFSGTGGKIVVDGSAYTGSNQTFTLLEAAAIAGTEPTIELVGFGDGATYTWDSATDVFTVSAVAPPPPLAIDEINLSIDSPNAIISWDGMDGATYTLQQRADLTVGSWSNAATGISGTGTIAVTNALDENAAFYRVTAEE